MAATYCILDDAYFYLKVLKPHLQVLFTTYPLLKSSILCRAPKIIPFSDWFWEYGVPFPMGEGFIWQGCVQAWNIEPTWQRWLLAGKILRLLWKQSFIVSINKWAVLQFRYFSRLNNCWFLKSDGQQREAEISRPKSATSSAKLQQRSGHCKKWKISH